MLAACGEFVSGAFLAVLLVGCGATTASGASTSLRASPVAEPTPGAVDAPTEPADACPAAAEDLDGFEDDDGCPDVDDDGDMVLDVCDDCRHEPETWNGVFDGDGCPDRVAADIRDEMVLDTTLHFGDESAALDRGMLLTVDVVARVLEVSPEITLARVIGHSDRAEGRRQRLAAQRADAVVDALVARGIARSRLVAESRGASEPADDGDTEIARAANRRVTFFFVGPPPPPPLPPPPAVVMPSEPSCPDTASPAPALS